MLLIWGQVSPFMEKGNVREYLRDHPEVAVLPILPQIADGLEYLHSKDVVHGDIRGVCRVNAHSEGCTRTDSQSHIGRITSWCPRRESRTFLTLACQRFRSMCVAYW